MRGTLVKLCCPHCQTMTIHTIHGHLVHKALFEDIDEELKHKVLCSCHKCLSDHSFDLVEVVRSLKYKKAYRKWFPHLDSNEEQRLQRP